MAVTVNTKYAQTRYNVTKSTGRQIKYIVIHYTATTASAENNCQYFGSANRDASADYFVNKDGSVCLFNGDIKNYYTWHCGDGKGKYGITNLNSVGIETVSAGEAFTPQQISTLTGLVGQLMATYNVPAANVVRHYDASRKQCPLPYINNTKWATLHSQITSGGSAATGATSVSWASASTNEEKVYRYLVGVAGFTPAGACGVLGNMYYESSVVPTRVQYGFGWSDAQYTSQTDNGTYKRFVTDSIGYGLVQFTYYTLKQGLYNRAKANGKSVGDMETQLVEIVEVLKSDYKGLYSTLTTSTDVNECCVQFLLKYEMPADQSTSVQNKRSAKAQYYYAQFKDLAVTSDNTSVTTSMLITLDPYTRDKALVEEFGYATKASGNSNMGEGMVATKKPATYPVSAINMNETLQDIFDLWGVSVATTSSGDEATLTTSGSGTQVSGQAKMKSGKTVTSGTYKEMPSGVSQTGIISDYTSYPQFYNRWTKGTTQRTVADQWGSEGKPQSNKVATVSGYYLIAVRPYFANCGDVLEVKFTDGTSFMAMVGDIKGSDATSAYGHMYGSQVSCVEWESCASGVSDLNSALKSWGIYGKKIAGMINYGTWFQ